MSESASAVCFRLKAFARNQPSHPNPQSLYNDQAVRSPVFLSTTNSSSIALDRYIFYCLEITPSSSSDSKKKQQLGILSQTRAFNLLVLLIYSRRKGNGTAEKLSLPKRSSRLSQHYRPTTHCFTRSNSLSRAL